MKVSKKIACISLVEILKLVRISLKKKLISCLHTTYFIYDSHFTTTSLGHCTQKVCTYINFGKRVNYSLGRLVNFGIKTENPSQRFFAILTILDCYKQRKNTSSVVLSLSFSKESESTQVVVRVIVGCKVQWAKESLKVIFLLEVIIL